MNKEQQNLTWACLPKEARNQIISTYFCKRDSDTEYNKGYVDAILHIYGIHNLTSDTEPEEMLMVKRSFVITQFEEAINREKQNVKNGSIEWACQYHGMQMAMAILFGDKSQPDKEKLNSPKHSNSFQFGKDELEHRLEQSSVQVEPKYKFSLGQKVVLHFYGGEKGTISERLPPQEGSVWNCYKVKELPYHLWLENELDPYTEPEV